MSLYVVGEKSYVERGNQISEMARLMRTEKKTCWRFLWSAPETWDLRDWRTRESSRILAKSQDMPDLEQHRCNRTEYSRSGATPLQMDCLRVISFGRFQMWSNTCSKELRTGQFSFGTGSQHIPDLEQHPYHMRVISFARFDNLGFKTPLLRDGVRVKSFHLCIITMFVVFCVAFIL